MTDPLFEVRSEVEVTNGWGASDSREVGSRGIIIETSFSHGVRLYKVQWHTYYPHYTLFAEHNVLAHLRILHGPSKTLEEDERFILMIRDQEHA